jgi:hypothetical protein
MFLRSSMARDLKSHILVLATMLLTWLMAFLSLELDSIRIEIAFTIFSVILAGELVYCYMSWDIRNQPPTRAPLLSQDKDAKVRRRSSAIDGNKKVFYFPEAGIPNQPRESKHYYPPDAWAAAQHRQLPYYGEPLWRGAFRGENLPQHDPSATLTMPEKQTVPIVQAVDDVIPTAGAAYYRFSAFPDDEAMMKAAHEAVKAMVNDPAAPVDDFDEGSLQSHHEIIYSAITEESGTLNSTLPHNRVIPQRGSPPNIAITPLNGMVPPPVYFDPSPRASRPSMGQFDEEPVPRLSRPSVAPVDPSPRPSRLSMGQFNEPSPRASRPSMGQFIPDTQPSSVPPPPPPPRRPRPSVAP